MPQHISIPCLLKLIVFLLCFWLFFNFSLVRSSLNSKIKDQSTQSYSSRLLHESVVNTFIIRVKVDEYQERQWIKEKVDSLAAQFQKDMNYVKISFVFLHIYFLALQGFAIKLDNPNDILVIEEMNLNYISSIEGDSIAHLTDFSQIGHFPQFAMNMHTIDKNTILDSEGVTVAIIDQGIRRSEPPLVKPGEQCNERVKFGCRVKKVIDVLRIYYTTLSLDEDEDIEHEFQMYGEVYGNHGTIVASLVGGTDTLAPGIAQKVTFHDYRTFDKTSRASFSLIQLALEYSILDNVDVIVFSFVSSGDLYKGGTLRFLKQDKKNEILVISSIGNVGSSGYLFQTPKSGEPDNVVTVGSIQNPFGELKMINLGTTDSMGLIHLGAFEFNFLDPQMTFERFKGGIQENGIVIMSPTNKFIGKNDTMQIKNKVVTFIICENPIDCEVKYLTVSIEDIVPSVLIFVCECNLRSTMFPYLKIPVGHIYNLAKYFEDVISENRITKFSFSSRFVHKETQSLQPNAFSSYGPSASFTIKPDIMAIGGSILSFIETVNGVARYRVLSGTSFSTANMGGMACAYVKWCQVHQVSVKQAQFLARLQNTAQPFVFPIGFRNFPTPYYGRAQTVLKQGAGLVNAHDMLYTEVSILPSKIEIHFMNHQDDKKLTEKREFTIYNNGPKEVRYCMTHTPGSAPTYFPSQKQYKLIILDAQFNAFTEGANYNLEHYGQTFFSVKPFSKKKVIVVFVLAASKYRRPFTFFNGYFKFTPIKNSPGRSIDIQEGYTILSLPYILIFGNIQDFPILAENGRKEAFLTDLSILKNIQTYLEPYSSTSFPIYRYPTMPFPVFTFEGNFRPVISLCFIFPIKQISFFLYDHYFRDAPIGRIAQYQSLVTDCHLFLATRVPILYKVGFRNIQNQVLDSSSLDWSGEYRVYGKEGSTTKKLKSGTYVICAKIHRRHVGTTPIPEYVWCSTPFFVYFKKVLGDTKLSK